MTQQQRRDKYLQKVFGEINSNDKRVEKTQRVQNALDRAHEIRQFEIRLYWQRSLFFWGFMFTFFSGFFFLYKEEKTFSISIMLLGLSIVGTFTACAWSYIERGSKSWQKNWELHIDFLEDEITGKLHKTILGTGDNFYSISSILSSFIKVMFFSWIGLFVISAIELGIFFVEICPLFKIKNFELLFCIVVPILTLVVLFFLFRKFKTLEKSWKTSKITLAKEKLDSTKSFIVQREFPNINFEDKN